MGWAHRLFGLCDHKWVEDKREALMARSKISPSQPYNIGETVYCHCEKCGMPRMFQLEIR